MHSYPSNLLLRREFVQWAALGSAAFMLPAGAFAAGRVYHGASDEFEPGDALLTTGLKSCLDYCVNPARTKFQKMLGCTEG